MKTILIVEDQRDTRKILCDLITYHGYTTLATADGIECLNMARRFSPDLILMDIQLPEISGLEVAKWIKEDEDLRHIPIIAVTAFVMRGDEETIREGGCDGYVAKPFDTDYLMSEIRRLIP